MIGLEFVDTGMYDYLIQVYTYYLLDFVYYVFHMQVSSDAGPEQRFSDYDDEFDEEVLEAEDRVSVIYPFRSIYPET